MNKLFAVLIIYSLSFPVFAISEQGMETVPYNQENLETLSTEEVKELENTSSIEEHDLIPVPSSLPSRYKQPYGKKNLVKKFVIAMLCVAGTSILLYGTLSIYNKLREGFIASASLPPEGEKPLDTPDDLTEAVKTFVEKTRWEN